MLSKQYLALLTILTACSVQAVTLNGSGEYVSNQQVDDADAYAFARNKALANASEKALILVEANREVIKTSNGDNWSRSEMRELSASLIKVLNESKTRYNTDQGTAYHVDITADFDDAQQEVLQQTFKQNAELRKLLQNLSAAQNQLLAEQQQTDRLNQQATNQTKALASKPVNQASVAHYEQSLNDTKAWIGQQQKTHIQMALRTIDMQQELEKARLSQAKEQESINAKMRAEAALKQQENAKVKANLQYIAAARISRFVGEHLPLSIGAVNVQSTGREESKISYSVQYQMASSDAEKVCSMFFDADLATTCRPSYNLKRIDVRFKTDVNYFDPAGNHASVWQSKSFSDGYSAHGVTLFNTDKPTNSLKINIGDVIEISQTKPTRQLREATDANSGVIKWIN